ncbi:MAG TPA: hypothetical protein VJ045_06485 [Hyphomicrobiaceae bacterium]|nr:hypothetical protein [Hyphomicrobiaceae bacterium]
MAAAGKHLFIWVRSEASRPIRLAAGEALTAWVYHYVEEAHETRPIASGRWKPRA